MNKLAKTIQVGAATATMLAATALPAFAANVNVEIKGNGSRSRNSARVVVREGSGGQRCHPIRRRMRLCNRNTNGSGITQKSKTSSRTNISVAQVTGNNTQNKNTGKNHGNEIKTGDSTVDVTVKNYGSTNLIELLGL